MNRTLRSTGSRIRASAIVLTLLATTVAPVMAAVPAAAAPAAVQLRAATEPTADALPTVQINGVVWAQAIVGNTVFVGGSFTSARPAGSPAGVNEVPRSNLLAYDLTTGELNPNFAPVMNQQVNAITASPDGSRIYVGGQFTTVDGLGRFRIAAFDTASGALVNAFQPKADYIVTAMAATNSTLFVGGSFSSANGSTRDKLAAFATANGALLNWAPSVDNAVKAMVLSPDASRLIVAGAFTTLNGVAARGSAAVDTTTGASLPWAANTTIVNGGTGSAILSLSTDGVSVYGGGYKFGGAGNLEGVFKADMTTGQVQWIEDCHGDTYGVYASATSVYQVGHAHYCGNNMGWAQPATWDYNRTLAFTKEATGTLIHEPLGYTNYAGKSAPSIKSWFPNLTVGAFTGKGQAAWTVTGNANYVLLGGEFTDVNGTPQQGLVRFAVKAISGAKSGPMMTGAQFKPVLTAAGAGAVRVAFRSNWDRDDLGLKYKVLRNGSTVYETTSKSTEWNRPSLGFTDSGLPVGSTQNYRLEVTDADGNYVRGDGVAVVVPATGPSLTPYGQTVLAQGASLYWPMNESTGSSAQDRAGYNDATLAAGVTTGAAGAVAGDTAMTFSGAVGGSLATAGELVSPDSYTTVAWFKTTTLRGGRILGFSDLATGSSGHRDRQIFMGNNGKLNYAVWGGAATGTATAVSFQTANAYNDGQWHQAVSTLGASGMALYVDGIKVGARTDVTTAERYPGYWRVGGDNASGFANTPTSGYFAGSIDEVSVYPTVLSQAQITAQFTASGRTSSAPSDAYGSVVFADEPTLYYRLGETGTTTVATDAAGGLVPGGYQGTATRGVAGAVPGVNTAVRFNGSTGFVSSNASFANPTTYSVEAWFNTTTTTGGGIIGFGNARTGTATTGDRMVYLQNNGRLVFGSESAAHTIVSANALNDGRWHHVVAAQGAAGMSLYVDSILVGANTWASPAVSTGYWRVGSTPTWGGSTNAYLNGSIDEAAVYPTVLTSQQVRAHYGAGGGALPNLAPTASFVSSVAKQSVTVDAAGSADSDGTLAAYSWDFGDGATATGVTASHIYATAGAHVVSLTVTDDRGAVASTTATVTTVSNVAPIASFSTAMSALTLTADGSAASDTDGTVMAYDWDFGDGSVVASGRTATHTFAVDGTYNVALTVTDNDGASHTRTEPITVAAPANQAPIAAFGSTVDRLVVDVTSNATDADGTVVSYSWDFAGLGTAAGQRASFGFPAAGTYPVTLTVTDDDGATASTTSAVSVTAEARYVTDAFGRTASKSWGAADIGGSWTLSSAASFGVTPGVGGTITLPTAGSQRTAILAAVNQSDVDLRVAVSLDKLPTGGAAQFSTSVRKVGTSEYRLTGSINPNGSVTLSLVRLVGGTASTVKAQVISGLTYVNGGVLNLRLRVAGSGSAELAAKAWMYGTPEPAAFAVTAVDATTVLQAPGAVAVTAYVSGAATNAPIVMSVKGIDVTSPVA